MKLIIFKKAKKYLLNLIYPKKCVECGKWGIWLCKKCAKSITLIKTPFCPYCKKLTTLGQFCPRCRQKVALNGVIAAGYYKGALKELVHKFKYDRLTSLLPIIMVFVNERLELGFPQGDLVLVPIPLHKSRLYERGFNQSELLAKKISQYYGIKEIDCLERVKKTESQIGLNREERQKNLEKAFKIKNRFHIKQIRNKTVLLVDDVATSCTTLNQAAIELKKYKVKYVWGLVVAKD